MPIKDPAVLTSAQDIVFKNTNYQPKDNGTTFCNLATQDVLRRMGYDAMTGLTADEMYTFVTSSKDWLIKPMADCQDLANSGTIIIAILPSEKLGQKDGHVNTVTPGRAVGSGHWNMDKGVPVCMNLGRAGTCFRSNGESFAFQPIPEFHALVSTL